MFFWQFQSAAFLPLIPPGVCHFTMEISRQSISFSLRFSYRFLTGSTYLKGRKVCGLKSGWLCATQPEYIVRQRRTSKLFLFIYHSKNLTLNHLLLKIIKFSIIQFSYYICSCSTIIFFKNSFQLYFFHNFICTV